MRSSHLEKPNSVAIVATAAAKISRNMWSTACARLSNPVTTGGKAYGASGVVVFVAVFT
jgi:hypothetical protein